MAHLTDKPLGLVKMQRELRAAQAEAEKWKAAHDLLQTRCLELETELKNAFHLLAKKNKARAGG